MAYLVKKILIVPYHNSKVIIELMVFLAQNIFLALRLKKKNMALCKDVVIINFFSKADLNKINLIYSTFNNKPMGPKLRLLLALLGSRLCLVAFNETRGLIGVIIFYFNRRDIKENTVHEAFIGILPEWQGKGVGTLLRQQAIKYFKFNGLKGVSSRVNISNRSSININKKLGYEIIERYFDPDLMESRAYMRLHFDKSNES